MLDAKAASVGAGRPRPGRAAARAARWARTRGSSSRRPRCRLDQRRPVTEVVRTGEPVLLRTLDDWRDARARRARRRGRAAPAWCPRPACPSRTARGQVGGHALDLVGPRGRLRRTHARHPPHARRAVRVHARPRPVDGPGGPRGHRSSPGWRPSSPPRSTVGEVLDTLVADGGQPDRRHAPRASGWSTPRRGCSAPTTGPGSRTTCGSASPTRRWMPRWPSPTRPAPVSRSSSRTTTRSWRATPTAPPRRRRSGWVPGPRCRCAAATAT